LSIHTQFHKSNHGPSITLSTDGKAATNPAATYEVASGADSFEDGIHIWRIKIGACVYVGVGVIDTTMTNYIAEFHLQVGCYVYYWRYYCSSVISLLTSIVVQVIQMEDLMET
jgi:hypothetical protein